VLLPGLFGQQGGDFGDSTMRYTFDTADDHGGILMECSIDQVITTMNAEPPKVEMAETLQL